MTIARVSFPLTENYVEPVFTSSPRSRIGTPIVLREFLAISNGCGRLELDEIIFA